MTKKELTTIEKAALNYMMLNLATSHVTESMGLAKSDLPNFDDYIIWNSHDVCVLDGGYDYIEVYDRLGMRSAYINEDDGRSYIECVVLEDYEPMYVNGDEVVTCIEVNVGDTELEDLDNLIDEVIEDYHEDDKEDM